MKILVACEESQAVTIEMRKLGHEAYSCDIEPCSGGHPEWHIQGDVIPLLDGFLKEAGVAILLIKPQFEVLSPYPASTITANTLSLLILL